MRDGVLQHRNTRCGTNGPVDRRGEAHARKPLSNSPRRPMPLLDRMRRSWPARCFYAGDARRRVVLLKHSARRTRCDHVGTQRRAGRPRSREATTQSAKEGLKSYVPQQVTDVDRFSVWPGRSGLAHLTARGCSSRSPRTALPVNTARHLYTKGASKPLGLSCASRTAEPGYHRFDRISLTRG